MRSRGEAVASGVPATTKPPIGASMRTTMSASAAASISAEASSVWMYPLRAARMSTGLSSGR
jgi:hypothetical protein